MITPEARDFISQTLPIVLSVATLAATFYFPRAKRNLTEDMPGRPSVMQVTVVGLIASAFATPETSWSVTALSALEWPAREQQSRIRRLRCR
jgi:hypothetical protein